MNKAHFVNNAVNDADSSPAGPAPPPAHDLTWWALPCFVLARYMVAPAAALARVSSAIFSPSVSFLAEWLELLGSH